MVPKTPELLAPAGTMEIVQAAFHHGADAVYVGIGQYNLRAHAPGFSFEELTGAVAMAHSSGKRIYATLNSMPGDEQIIEIEALVKKIAAGNDFPDALIVSDPGVVALCREHAPAIRIHLSTQTGTFNSRSIAFWRDQGVKRIVLPREMSLAEIAAMRTINGVETEVFIHGAMCVSISGRCLLGAYMAGRHPNRGDCPQPCRLRYRITHIPDETSDIPLSFDAEETDNGVFLLNSKDLNTLAILPQIITAGVASLKIEGRNKSLHYISSVVKVYRAALDRCMQTPGGYTPDASWSEELDRIDHRPYTTGFYTGEYQMQAPFGTKVASAVRVVGVVREMMAENRMVVDVKNTFVSGEKLDVLPIRKTSIHETTLIGRITDLQGLSLDCAITNRLVVVETVQQLHRGDILRRLIIEEAV
jgi:putative protease